jgi:O-antigen ligase
MAVLGTFSMALLIIIIFTNKFFFKTKVSYIFLLLILDLFLVYCFSGANKVEQFYGTIGRNFGLLSQLSLVIICVASMMFFSPELVYNFKKLLVLTGSINMAYGIIQVMGLDFVKNWTTTYANSTRGFFGNPNQYSAFMAIVALVSLSNMLKRKRATSEQLGSFIYILIAILNMYFSKSIQGYVVFGIGALTLIFIFLKIDGVKKVNLYMFITFSVCLLTCAALDIFQKSPWNPILYSPTVSVRGDYWRAGINMGLDHPLFGVGLDKYLEWYRINRDNLTFSRAYSAEVADSAHNVFIDYFATGGFPLLIIYLLINIFVIWKIIKIVVKKEKYEAGISGLIVIYVAYLMQSLISPVHLGIAIWGWVSMGLILGANTKFIINTDLSDRKVFSNKFRFQENLMNDKKFIVIFSLTTTLGLLISSSFMIQDMRFRSGISQNSTVERVYKSAYIWPKSGTRMAQASWLLYKNNFKEQSLKIALDAVKYSPNNYYAWLALYSRTDLDPVLKAKVLKNISRLEPRTTGIILFK